MENSENTARAGQDAQIDWQNVAANNFVKITKLEAQRDSNKATIEALVSALERAEAMALNLRSEILREAKVEGPTVAENLWLHAMGLRKTLNLAKES